MSSWHGGKGSKPRKVSQQKFNDSWERIFGGGKDETHREETENRVCGQDGCDGSDVVQQPSSLQQTRTTTET